MIPALEMALIVKLRSLGQKINFDGLVALDERRELVRKALLPFDDVTYTVSNGRRITLGMQFATVYREQP